MLILSLKPCVCFGATTEFQLNIMFLREMENNISKNNNCQNEMEPLIG